MNVRFSLGLAFLVTVTSAGAQTPKPLPKAPPPPMAAGPIIKAPIELGPKRAASYNAALAKIGVPTLTVPPPPSYAKLTPIAPVTNGARIVQVGSSVFVGPSAERPDGLFIVEPAAAGTGFFPGFPNPIVMAINVPKGTLKLEFSIAASQLYFVDCKISQAASNISGFTAQGPVTFARSGSTASQSVAPDDGHFIYAFRTGATGPFGTEWVQITFPQTSYFFGCEITKST